MENTSPVLYYNAYDFLAEMHSSAAHVLTFVWIVDYAFFQNPTPDFFWLSVSSFGLSAVFSYLSERKENRKTLPFRAHPEFYSAPGFRPPTESERPFLREME
ncbi:MAG: hypothetical protein WA194_00090 [Patescibacteria group bacterium]